MFSGSAFGRPWPWRAGEPPALWGRGSMAKPERSSRGMLGGFSPLDGSVEFYGRVSAFLRPEFVVVDLGAGRGGWFADGEISDFQRSLRVMKGRVAKVVGADVDEA